jgi:hypothetical protein
LSAERKDDEMEELATAAPTNRELVRQATLPPKLKLKSLAAAPTYTPVSAAPKDPFRQARKLVLCFDGTSNEFQGDGTDTNILKIYGMLDKNIPEQCTCSLDDTMSWFPG